MTRAAAVRDDPRGGAPAQERELRAQGKKTMRKLLDAGMNVFERRGYHAARVDDIVKGARTSHGTFYLYFANKEDLLLALIHDCVDEMTALSTALPPIAPGEEGYQALHDWLGRFSDLYAHYGPVIRAWIEAELHGSEFGRLGQTMLGGFSQSLATRVAESAPAGVDPQVAALAFVAMIERFNYFVITRQIDFDRDTVVDTLARIAHQGLFGGTAPRRGRARR